MVPVVGRFWARAAVAVRMEVSAGAKILKDGFTGFEGIRVGTKEFYYGRRRW
jgi:hypothetical protein